MGDEKNKVEQTTIVDFLYKDMSLINSYYSQCFSGVLNSVVKKQISADETASETTAGLGKILGAKISANESIHESIESNINPMDIVIIDLIQALNVKVIENLDNITKGTIVGVKGNIMFRDYNVINELLPLMLEADIIPGFNSPMNPNAKGKYKNFTMGKFMQKLISVIPFGLEFELITKNSEHITAIIKEEYLTIKRNDLIRTYGLMLPDNWTIIGIIDKAPIMNQQSNSEFKQGIDAITEFYYETMNENYSGFVLRPIVVYREI